MSTKEERGETDKKIDYIIPKACKGDKFAQKYMYDIAFVARKMDDLYDGDYEVSKKELEQLFYLLLVDIPTNPFFLKNFQLLIGQHVIVYNAWVHSNLWIDDNDDTKRIYAHVLRDYIGELVPLVAFLTGGTENMNKISLEARKLFLKEF
jgi:hypothetical protein